MVIRLLVLGLVVAAYNGIVYEEKAVADNVTSDSDVGADAVRFVIEGIREERAKFKSGKCRFTGHFTSRWCELPEKDLEGPVEGLVAIDGSKLRFDLSRPGWIVDPDTIEVAQTPAGGSKRATADTVKGILHKKFADNTVRSAFWNGLSPLVVISQSKDFTDRAATEYIEIRGCTLYDRISRSSAPPFVEVLEHILKIDESVELPREDLKVTRSVVTGDKGVWSLIWKFEHPVRYNRFSLSVDVNSGFTPISYMGESAPSKLADDPAHWRVEWANRTEWAELNHVWVPTHHEWEWADGKERPMERMTFDFAWDTVNEPLESALFDYTSFALPDEVAVQDVSSGQLVWIKPFPQIDPSREIGSATHTVWMIAAVAPLLLLLAYRLRSRSSSPLGSE